MDRRSGPEPGKDPALTLSLFHHAGEFWWPGFPVLVYFKEVQTKPEGQIHFFPIIMDGRVLYEVMSERCGSSMNSGR